VMKPKPLSETNFLIVPVIDYFAHHSLL
jgi:hypothetical protein